MRFEAYSSAPPDRPRPRAQAPPPAPVIFVVDDEHFAREAVRGALADTAYQVRDFASCEEFLSAYEPQDRACLVLDAHLPGMSGLECLRRVSGGPRGLQCVMISGSSDISTAVAAMKAGATDFIEKPIRRERLLDSVERALERAGRSEAAETRHETAVEHMADLTPRQREIMALVMDGQPSKNIAADLRISRRTVETHRAAIMRKTGSASIPALARLAVAAAGADSSD